MSDIKKEVELWLSTKVKSSTLSDLDLSCPTTLHVLHDLMMKNKTADKAAVLQTDKNNEMAVEYEIKANQLDEMLKSIGFKVSDLSLDGQKNLESLAEAAKLLQLSDFNRSALLYECANLDCKTTELQHEISELTDENNQIHKKIGECMAKEVKCKSELKEEQCSVGKKLESVLERKSSELPFLRERLESYTNANKAYEDQLSSTLNMKPHLTYAALNEQHTYLNTVIQKTHDCERQLKDYHNLPPNVELAKEELNKAKLKLKEIEEQLALKFNNMSMK